MVDSFDQKLDHEVASEFESRKQSTWQLIESYERLGMSERASKVKLCGTDLAFRAPVDLSDTAKLYQANFCKDRLCWMCSWRRTKKIFGQVSKVMDRLEANRNSRYVFVTLTVRNCSGQRLVSTINALFEAFHLFNKRAQIRHAFDGAFRTLEVTYNPDMPECLMFHPHLHIIYSTDESYFDRRKNRYITHDDLMQIWRECACLNYNPGVDIRIVKPSVGGNGDVTYKQAIAEVAKYTVKPEKLFLGNTNDEIDHAVWYLSGALAGRRLCSFTGNFKKAAAELKLDDLNDGDLVNTDNEKLRSDVRHMLIHYRWNVGFGYERTYVTYEKEE